MVDAVADETHEQAGAQAAAGVEVVAAVVAAEQAAAELGASCCHCEFDQMLNRRPPSRTAPGFEKVHQRPGATAAWE